MDTMDDTASKPRETGPAKAFKTLCLLLALSAIAFAVFAIIRTRDTAEQTPQSQTTPAEETTTENSPPQANPNNTGGSSGVGTGTSNDNSTGTPSPAGGADTDGERTP